MSNPHYTNLHLAAFEIRKPLSHALIESRLTLAIAAKAEILNCPHCGHLTAPQFMKSFTLIDTTLFAFELHQAGYGIEL